MTRPILLDYYEGAYGPTIRVDTQTAAQLTAVRQLFQRLAAGETVQADFCEALACRAESIEALTVRSLPVEPRKTLELIRHGSHGPVFSWANALEDWEECAEKVDGLLYEDTPGHQYLTREGVDDALVELCYKE